MFVAAWAPGVVVVVAPVYTVLGIMDARCYCPHRPWFHGRLCGAPDFAVNLRDAFVLIMLVNI